MNYKKYKYTCQRPTNFSEYNEGLYANVCHWHNNARSPDIFLDEVVYLIYKRKDDLATTFYVPRLKLSISTNNEYFLNNFIAFRINYNDYWAKLNE